MLAPLVRRDQPGRLERLGPPGQRVPLDLLARLVPTRLFLGQLVPRDSLGLPEPAKPAPRARRGLLGLPVLLGLPDRLGRILWFLVLRDPPGSPDQLERQGRRAMLDRPDRLGSRDPPARMERLDQLVRLALQVQLVLLERQGSRARPEMLGRPDQQGSPAL